MSTDHLHPTKKTHYVDLSVNCVETYQISKKGIRNKFLLLHVMHNILILIVNIKFGYCNNCTQIINCLNNKKKVF